jgi:hypothetical protein
MKKLSGIVALLLAFAITGLAETQMAIVTSAGPFQLRGAHVTPGPGVPSWPVLPGDTITAGAAAVTLTFPDGSTIVLSPHTSAVVTLTGSTPVVALMSGAAHYTLTAPTAVTLQCKRGMPADGQQPNELRCDGSRLPAAWWIAATGATAGVVAGVVLTRGNGPQVSPTR